MRRSASPNKGSGPRAAFKPLTISAASAGTIAKHTSATGSHPPLTKVTQGSPRKTVQELRDEVAQLEKLISDLLAMHNAERKALGQPEQDPAAIVQAYIRLLTEYNQVKDSAQVLFDKIADIEQLSSRTVHERYGLSERD